MVQKIKMSDMIRAKLEIKAGEGGDWKVVKSQPEIQAGTYKWQETNVAPCNNQIERL